MIEIKLDAGLGNRMRALDSALALGRAVGVPVRMIWTLGADLNCPFEELFEPIPGMESFRNFRTEHDPILSSRRHILDFARQLKPLVNVVRRAKAAKRAAHNITGTCKILGNDDVERLAQDRDALISLASKFDVRIDTFYRFFRGEADYVGFRPTAEIKERIDHFSLGEKNAVGVHIRTSDFDPYQTHGPLDKWVATLKSIHDADASVKFFVASNSQPVEEVLENELPTCIVRQKDKSYARDDPEGVRHALVDLYCLASCKRLLGSHHSSFTDTAREIGRIPCEIM